MNEEPLENPVFGYVVMAVALLVSLLSATVFGQVPANLFPATQQVAPPTDGSGQDSSKADPGALDQKDRVITVNGKQVGWIGRQHTPLHTAIDAVASGNSRLLIQPAKFGSIRSIPVKLGTISESLGN